MPTTVVTKLPILNRFTCLPIALDILCRRKITLLSPQAWEDRNDAYYLERYRDERKLRSVLAISFSLEEHETFHLWRIFSNGPSGVCIEFDKDKLLKSIPNGKGYSHRHVTYQWIGVLKKTKPALETWPFLKRMPFKDEREYRVIFETKTENLRTISLPIDLAWVTKVTLSPWLAETVADSVRRTIQRIDGCAKVNVNRSSLIDNAGWKEIIG